MCECCCLHLQYLPFLCVCAECHDFVVFADNVLRRKLIILLQGIALYKSYH